MSSNLAQIGKIARNPQHINTAISTTANVTSKVRSKAQSEKPSPSFEDALSVARELENLLQKSDDLKEKVKEKFKSWKSKRNEIISSLRRLAEELHQLHSNVNATNLGGSIAGVVGGGATIAGLALAPFTMGASLVLTAGGAVVGAAGGVASLTASLTEMGITKNRCEEATNNINEDNERTVELTTLIEEVQKVSVKLNKICEENADILEIVLTTIASGTTAASSFFAAKGVYTGVKTAQAIKENGEMAQKAMQLTRLSRLVRNTEHLRDVKDVKSLFQGSATVMSKTSRMVSGVFSVAFIGLDIWSIVTTSQDIHSGSKSEAGKKLEEKADALQGELKEMDKILGSLI